MFEQIIKRCDDLIKVYQGKKTEIERAVSKAIADLRASDATFRGSFSGIFGVHKGSFTVGGRADTYYPVVFNAPGDSTRIGSGSESTFNMVHTLEVTRFYNQSPMPAAGNSEAPYNGAHWLSMQFKMEFTGIGWDGGPDVSRIAHHKYNYRRGVGAVRSIARECDDVVIWLRGGGTVYNWSSSFPMSPAVHCENGSEKLLSSGDMSGDQYGRVETRITPVTDVELAELEAFVATASTANFPQWVVSGAWEWSFKNKSAFSSGRPRNGIGYYDSYIVEGRDSASDAISKFGLYHNVKIDAQSPPPLESKKNNKGLEEYQWGVWLRSRFCRWYHQKNFTDISNLSVNNNYRFENTKYTRMTATNPNGDVGIT